MVRALHVCPTAAGVAKPAPPVWTLSAGARHRTPALASCSRLGTCVSNTTRRQGSTRVSAAATQSAPVKPNLWWRKNPPPNMKDVSNVQELVDELAAAGDKLVIIDFYAGWCNACKAVYPKLRKICLANEDIVMLKVNWDDARPVCKSLGIKVLPYFNFYRGVDGKVAAFSASVAKLQRLRDAIEEHSSPRCQLGPHEGPWLDEFPEVMPSFDRDYMPVLHPLLPGETLHKTLRDATKGPGGSGLRLGGFASGEDMDMQLAGAR